MIKKTMFEAADGTFFKSAKECKEYEEEKDVLDQVRAFLNSKKNPYPGREGYNTRLLYAFLEWKEGSRDYKNA